jgi:peptide/nickel transport system permease protein
MTSFVLRRLLQGALIVLLMSLLVFLAVYAIGDPAEILIDPEATPEARAQVIASLGLDQPLYIQYWRFLLAAAGGDLGRSFVYSIPAIQLILQRLPATLELALVSTLLSILIGIPLGLFAGLKPNSLPSKAIMIGSILGFSLPSFWVGLLLILTFGVYLSWFPVFGRGETVSILGIEWSLFTADGLRHLFLPAMNLALFNISLLARMTRAGVMEAMPQDYVRFGKAMGLSPSRILFGHVLKNIMIPIVTVIGMEFGSLIAFAVVTESIFNWPGMGKLIIDSINYLDRPVIVAYLMVVVVIFVLINIVVDVLYAALDPRVRLGESHR